MSNTVNSSNGHIPATDFRKAKMIMRGYTMTEAYRTCCRTLAENIGTAVRCPSLTMFHLELARFCESPSRKWIRHAF